MSSSSSNFFKNAASLTSQLPHIVFLESHADPITPQIMKSLLPVFSSFGYKQFNDEAPPNYRCQDKLKYSQSVVSEYQLYADLAKNLQLDINTNEGRLQLIEQCIAHLSQDEKNTARQNLMVELQATVVRYPSKLAYCDFYTELEKLGWSFKGIDLAVKPSDTAADHVKRNPEREANMASSWEGPPAIDSLGLNHLLGIQNILMKKAASAAPIQPSIYFYLHSIAPLAPIEVQTRNGEIQFPLGLHIIDASKRTFESVKEEVIQTISHYLKPEEDLKSARNSHDR